MNASAQKLAQRKRWRGVVLELVYDGHVKQESRLDHLVLWGMMRDLGHDVGQSEVLTLLQSLGEMKCLSFNQVRDAASNAVRISEIQITERGIAIVEREETSPLIHVLL